MIFDEIYQYLSNNQILTPHQSGLRPGDSTINQLLLITQKIYAAFDEVPSKETRAVFFDLSKAFDRVSHDGLIYKLEMCGISGMLLALLRSFLPNHKHGMEDGFFRRPSRFSSWPSLLSYLHK